MFGLSVDVFSMGTIKPIKPMSLICEVEKILHLVSQTTRGDSCWGVDVQEAALTEMCP